MCKGTARRSPTSSSPYEGVESDFVPDLGLRPMARDHAGVLVQGIEPGFDGPLDGLGVAPPEVGPPDAPAKERIAGQQQLGGFKVEAHGAGGVPRRVQPDACDLAEWQLLVV